MPVNVELVEQKLAEGIRLYKIGDYEGAIKLFKEIIDLKQEDFRIYYSLGLAYYANW